MTPNIRVRSKDGLARKAATNRRIADKQLQMLRDILEKNMSLSAVVEKCKACGLDKLSRSTLTKVIRVGAFDKYFSESERLRLRATIKKPEPPPSTVDGKQPFRPKNADEIKRTLDIVPMLDSSISQLEDYCKKYCPGPTDDAISSTPLKPDRLVELENILDNLADHTRIATILVKKVGIGSLQVARQHHPEFIPCLDRLECLYISLTTVDFANPGPQVPIHDYPWICLILAITKFQIRMPDDSLFRLHVDRASEGEKGDWGMDYAPSHVGDKNDGGQPDNRLEGKRETRPNWIHRLKGLVEEIYGHTSVYYGGSDFFLRGSCWVALVTGHSVTYQGRRCTFSPHRVSALLRNPTDPKKRRGYDHASETDSVCHDCHNGSAVKNGDKEACINGLQHLHFGTTGENNGQKKVQGREPSCLPRARKSS